MKRYIAILMTAVMMMSLAACGGSGEGAAVQKDVKEKETVTPLKLYKANNYLMHEELYQEEWAKLYLSEENAEKYHHRPYQIRSID